MKKPYIFAKTATLFYSSTSIKYTNSVRFYIPSRDENCKIQKSNYSTGFYWWIAYLSMFTLAFLMDEYGIPQ